MRMEQKILDAAREFGFVGVKMKLNPDELLSALHIAISVTILAKRKMVDIEMKDLC